VGLAFDWADTQEANELPGRAVRLRAMRMAVSTQEPALVRPPWGMRERLVHEKTAIGFYLSGHLFDARPTRCGVLPARIADLVDSREPQLLAGIVSDLRVVNGQRGRVMIFKLDDGSEAIEAVANEELSSKPTATAEGRRARHRAGQGAARPLLGGLRLNVQQVWDLAAARARFGRYLAVA
jgi:DNA polymerase-3 subunit alpha